MAALCDLRDYLLSGLDDVRQQGAVSSKARRLLVVAGAGAGKTEVMARRIAWLVGVEGVPKDAIVAFTFTERAAEEMKFRIRKHITATAATTEDVTLGDMYIGTIHAYCLNTLRALAPDDYHNFDVIDDIARLSLLQRNFYQPLGMPKYQSAMGLRQYSASDSFLNAYDILNEYGILDVHLADGASPAQVTGDWDWIKAAHLATNVGTLPAAEAFATCAARFYALLRSRRFLDFSTVQNELVRLLRSRAHLLEEIRTRVKCVIVDEAQDLNSVQRQLLDLLLHSESYLVAVGDHRQAIFGFRGSLVKIVGDLHQEVASHEEGDVVELEKNYRSTSRIIKLANQWARTITPPVGLPNPDMKHGDSGREDYDPSHVGLRYFDEDTREAEWIADEISRLVRDKRGAQHDMRDEGVRGLEYADIAILLRASTRARTFMRALERRGIPAVFRAGPDLFSQPEVLLFLAALARAAGCNDLSGDIKNKKSLPARVHDALGVSARTDIVISKAADFLRSEGLLLAQDVGQRLATAATLISRKLEGNSGVTDQVDALKSEKLRRWLRRTATPRRIFPQDLLHMLFEEGGANALDDGTQRGQDAMFHLGALSTIVTGIESSGWTDPKEFKYQIIALSLWGARNARTEEEPLLVQPSAVTIATIHAVKGLEYPAVFIADVKAKRFPSDQARIPKRYPFDGPITATISAADHADNAARDHERRLMYVALTRAERYLAISGSGTNSSLFIDELERIVRKVGGTVVGPRKKMFQRLVYAEWKQDPTFRFVTSFSDLRYYLECPHDYYLRKVLRFAPTIAQEFGYGRGIHNVLRAIHTDPTRWAKLARDPDVLKKRVAQLVNSALFYLRYTTGKPLENLRKHATEAISDYVVTYQHELSAMQFEPERAFETLLPEAQALVSGAIDLVRMDDPPRVSLIDFKSGRPDNPNASKLDEEEMRLQVALYALAAKRELEWDPNLGLVRYVGAKNGDDRELRVPLDTAALSDASESVTRTVNAIRDRRFRDGPRKNHNGDPRCSICDLIAVCGLPIAERYRSKNDTITEAES